MFDKRSVGYGGAVFHGEILRGHARPENIFAERMDQRGCAFNDCRDAVAAMNASYSKDFQLKGKIVDAFSSMDSSYDLEKLSTLYQEEVKSPKALDCKADPSGTTSKANTERAAYDKQARTFERALTKNEANQN